MGKLKKSPSIVEFSSIASLEERQEFFTSIMRDVDEKISDRLKAADVLCKLNGDFSEKVELSGKVSLVGEVQIFRVPDNGRD